MNHWVCVTHRLLLWLQPLFFFLSTCPIRQLRHEVWRDWLPCAAKTDLLYKGEIWNTPPAAAFMEMVTVCLLPLACAAFGAPRKWPSKGDAAGCLDTHATRNDPPEEKLLKQPMCVWCVSSGAVTEITNPKQKTRQREGFYFNSTPHFYWKVAESHLNPNIFLQYLFEPGPSRVRDRSSTLTLNGLLTAR